MNKLASVVTRPLGELLVAQLQARWRTMPANFHNGIKKNNVSIPYNNFFIVSELPRVWIKQRLGTGELALISPANESPVQLAIHVYVCTNTLLWHGLFIFWLIMFVRNIFRVMSIQRMSGKYRFQRKEHCTYVFIFIIRVPFLFLVYNKV